MNYLAHLLLSGDSDEGLVGAFLGDFVKGRLAGHDLPPAILEAVRLHRRIDSFVDAHPAHRASRQRVSPPRRRYAGVLVDLFYDHCLACRWSRYSDEPFARFRQRAYRALVTHAERMSPRARRVATVMAREDWLDAYRRTEGVDRALHGLDRRLRRPGPLAGGAAELRRDYHGFVADFDRLYPDLLTLVGGGANGAVPARSPALATAGE